MDDGEVKIEVLSVHRNSDIASSTRIRAVVENTSASYAVNFFKANGRINVGNRVSSKPGPVDIPYPVFTLMRKRAYAILFQKKHRNSHPQ